VIRNQRGVALITSVLVSGIIISAASLSIAQLVKGRKAVRIFEARNAAEDFCAELMEFFVGFTSAQLAGYLRRDPPQFSALIPAHPLCAHVNLLDRTATLAAGPEVLRNADPLAALPVNTLIENNQSFKFRANRFYQVMVVDSTTLAPNPAACGRIANPTNTAPCGVRGASDYVLCAAERFMVAVGVSFVPTGKDETGVERVSLSAMVDP
jgi:hypothetical protein